MKRDRVLVDGPSDRDVYLWDEGLHLEMAAADASEPAMGGEVSSVGAEDDAATLAAGVQVIMRMRSLRSNFFEETLFADPAWDMMLDLMEARLRRTKVSISSLCAAGRVPATTALRWVKTLTEKGILVRRPDAGDRRRVYVELSDSAAEAMMGWLSVARQHLVRAAA
ncbi:winged helix DNA-binding protein [Hephaestia caeni]|nr:winged helix DNA-binding protein [Hephaestia caeni]